MTSKYDLAVIGATAAGRTAARWAAEQGYRVALVEQGAGLAEAKLYAFALRDRAAQQPHSGLNGFTAALAQAERASAVLGERQSPLVLGDHGVDYIAERGAFTPAPALRFHTAQRQLTASAYLLAPAWQTRWPQIAGLAAAHCATPEQLWTAPRDWLAGDRLAVLGDTELAVSLAQSCQRLGWSVTLLAPARLLPHCDRHAAYLLQAQLEADGVEVLNHSPVQQIRALDGQTWLQAGDRALAVSAILLASGLQPDFTAWNLANRVALAPNGQARVNAYLQTSHPRIFACRRSDTAIASVEAALAAANALHRRPRRLCYQHLPVVLATEPPLAAVGWTETQAKRCLAGAAIAATVDAPAASRALLSEASVGSCTLIASRQGAILGAHALGLGAEEWIGAIALAMQQNWRVADLARMPVVRPSMSELIPLAARAVLRQM